MPLHGFPKVRRPLRRGRKPAPPALSLVELLEARLAMASSDSFAIAGIKDAQPSDYPPFAIALAPAAQSKPDSATFSINGGATFTRSGDQIVQINTWTGPMWGMRLADDVGGVIYPGNAAWKIDVAATWTGEAPVAKSIYYVTGGVASPIVFPDLDWTTAPTAPTVRATPYEQTAGLVIDRTKGTTITLDVTTLVNGVIPSASKYGVEVASAKNADGVWQVVKAQPSPDGTGIVISVAPDNDTMDAGSVALKVTDLGDPSVAPRYIGVQVTDLQGALPVKPQHLAIGAVNQNGDNDNAFFRGTLPDDPTGMKLLDYQYIYLNGGPLQAPDGSANGAAWRRFYAPYGYEGKKLIQSMREAWKGGSIPTVVYYNIMCPNESSDIAYDNIRNQAFIGSYFEDLKFTLDTIRGAANGSAVSFIMEPDFLAYMMQRTFDSGNQAPASSIALGYDIVQLAKDKGVIAGNSSLVGGPGSTLVDFVKVINESVRYLSTKAGTSEKVNLQLGWKFNLWANQAQSGPDGGSWNQGISKITDYYLAHPKAGESPADAFKRGQAFIDTIAAQTAEWYFNAGVTSAGMEFMALDKYGTDGGNPYNISQTTPGYTDPANARWLFNADHWTNYLRYASVISKRLAELAQVGSMPIHLWQIPVGHVNTSATIDAPITNSQQNPATGNSPDVAAYEDSAVTWIFGDTFTGKAPTDDTGKVLAVATGNPPSGYDPSRTYQAVFSGGGGSGAAGVAVIDSKGNLVGIQMTSGGSGYTSAPTVTLPDGPAGATFQALIRSGSSAYWQTNVAADAAIGYDAAKGLVTWGDHLQALRDAGVEAILFGPGLPNATNGGGYANQLAQDGYFWATKAQNYLRDPQKLLDPIQGGATNLRATAAPVLRKVGTTPVAMVQVTRSGSGLDTAQEFPLAVLGGDADVGSDYSRREVQKAVVRFAPGQSAALVPIPLLATRAPQPAERLRLRVGSAAPEAPAALVTLLLGTTAPAPTPAPAVTLASTAGRRMFIEATPKRAALALLSQPTDRTGSDQGLRALALVLNAGQRPALEPQDGASLAATRPVAEGAFAGGGVSLAVMGRVLGEFPVEARVVHGAAMTLAQFRRQALATLGRRDGFVIADYDLGATGQGLGGHAAALGAYDRRSDRFLVIDPSGSVHRPQWVKARDLWQGMRAVDPRSGTTRGMILVRA